MPLKERDLRLAEHDRERMKCPDCGRPIAECSDPSIDLWAYRRICATTMARKAAEEDFRELHKDAPWHNGTFTDWVKDRDPAHPYHFDWGVIIGAADYDVNPDDEFRRLVNQSPFPPSGVSEDVGLVEQGEEHGSQDRDADDDA